MTHDENTAIDKQVTYDYELDSLDIAVGKHVKVTQADTGGWKLYMKTATGFENVGTENGTIRISTKLYDYEQDATGFAGALTGNATGLSGTPAITVGVVTAASLDISGDVDIDGTLEADAITINGTTLAETISDTVGAMVGSNTETGIAVTYDDSDNTLDFVLAAAQTGITSLLATDIKIGEDDQTKIDFETADEIHFYANNVEQVYLGDNIFGPQSDSDVDLGTTSVRWKDAYIDSITTTGNITSAGTVSFGSITDCLLYTSPSPRDRG